MVKTVDEQLRVRVSVEVLELRNIEEALLPKLLSPTSYLFSKVLSKKLVGLQ